MPPINYVLGTMLNRSHGLSHLILTVTTQGGCSYPHSTDEKAEAERLSDFQGHGTSQ